MHWQHELLQLHHLPALVVAAATCALTTLAATAALPQLTAAAALAAQAAAAERATLDLQPH